MSYIDIVCGMNNALTWEPKTKHVSFDRIQGSDAYCDGVVVAANKNETAFKVSGFY